MTQQEQQLLNGLIERVNGTQLSSKDAEAESLLNNSFRQNADALYILCQTVLVQQFAMDNAQRQLTDTRAEIDALKQQAAKPEQHGSFLGNLFGLNKGNDTSQPNAPAPAQGGNQPTGYMPVHNPQTGQPNGYPPPPPAGYGYGAGYAQPGYPQGGYPQGGYGAPMGGGGMFGGGGGFLQGAMQTAAGVVAGEFAFRAIEDVFHGFGGGGGRGFEGDRPEVVNNYYDSDSSARGGDNFGDRLQSADNLPGGLSPDIEDRRGDAQGFFGAGDASDDSAAFDSSGDDASNFADSNDDSGSYDDSGSGGDDNSF